MIVRQLLLTTCNRRVNTQQTNGDYKTGFRCEIHLFSHWRTSISWSLSHVKSIKREKKNNWREQKFQSEKPKFSTIYFSHISEWILTQNKFYDTVIFMVFNYIHIHFQRMCNVCVCSEFLVSTFLRCLITSNGSTSIWMRCLFFKILADGFMSRMQSHSHSHVHMNLSEYILSQPSAHQSTAMDLI